MPTYTSPIPAVYYAIFAIYEPLLCTAGFFGAFWDPEKTFTSQAPWPPGTPSYDRLPPATVVTLLQLAHCCGILGMINIFVLTAVKRHVIQPHIQEKIVASLLTPLLMADVSHLGITFYALGEYRWRWQTWPPILWSTFLIGTSLLIPRFCWYLGMGRYVAARDNRKL